MENGKWRMENEEMKTGLEALAGDVPLPPAKASSPALIYFIFHFPFSILH
jgi:hypothetical protein